jgi:lipopolysaccharide transport system permease protein
LVGVLWISLSFGIFVSVKVLIFGMMATRIDGDYFAVYLTLGFFSWQFISQVINASPTVFLANENWIQNDPIEMPVFVFQTVARSLFDLCLTGIVVVGVLAYFGFGGGVMSLLAIPALLTYVVNALWVVLLLGVICTRYRDIAHLIGAGMRVMFFLTPIFWLPSFLDERVRDILWWNPFAHFLWILRTPVLDQAPALESWLYVGVVTILGWAAALTAFAMYRKRIIFWF